MIKIKHNGFTLPEVLITLTVVGALAALVLPGLIKDLNNKANMALLQGTVANISDAVQQEIIQKKAKSIWETDVYNNPSRFLKNHFDYSRDTNVFKTLNAEGEYVDVEYYSVSGQKKGGSHPTGEIILKNGVYIGIRPDINTLVIDLNGPEPPNIIGVDYFGLEIVRNTNTSTGVRMGDVGAFRYDDQTDTQLKTSCKSGESAKCYALVERSGYDPNNLD